MISTAETKTVGEPETAAEWMAKLHGTDDPQVHQAYEKWLQARPENRQSAESLDQVWQLAGGLEDDPMVREILEAPPRRARSGSLRGFLGGGWQSSLALRPATAMLFGLAIFAIALFGWRLGTAGDVYETASGEQRVVELQDGSKLHLNVATRLEVALRSDIREVRLVRGQAFFEVSPDEQRPFVVTAGDKEITVLGTKFDVLLQGRDTRVTVVEGRVAVTTLVPTVVEPTIDASASGSPPVQVEVPASRMEQIGSQPEGEAIDRLELTARDAISWPRSSAPSRLVPKEAIASVQAWRSGKVVFESTPLDQAVAELDRYTPVRVRLDSAELASVTVSGVFFVDRLANVESLVFALESSLPIVAEQRGDELVLLASG